MKRLQMGGQLVVGLVLSAVFIWLSVRSVDWSAAWSALKGANYLFLVPIMGLTLLAFWIRAVRWGWLLLSVKPIPLPSLFSATMIGFAANNLLPRAGELVRPWTIGRRERISRSSAFATVIVERIVDIFFLLLILAFVLAFHPFPGWLQQAGLTALAINVALLVVLIVIERNPKRAARVSDWVGAHLPARIGGRVAEFLRNFGAGLGVLRHGWGLFWVSVHSILMFGVTALGLQACMWAFRLDVPWYAGFVLLIVTAFGISVAPTPGYLGVIQYACKVGLGFFGVDAAQSLSFSFYYHVSQFLPITAVGLYYLGRQGLSLTQVTTASQEEVTPTT